MLYHILSEDNNSTLVSEYTPAQRDLTSYESEAELEQALISLMQELGYTYVQLHSAKQLQANLREQISTLNKCRFTEDEWNTFYSQILANPSDTCVDKSVKFHRHSAFEAVCNNGERRNIKLFDRANIHNNKVQVVNQLVLEDDTNRGDVTILVNGLPLVHIELKRRGVSIQEAFNQIKRYKRDSFAELLDWVQLFVISNGTFTRYYSNTVNANLNYNFTSAWADAKNKPINELMDFAELFLAPRILRKMLASYCVLTHTTNELKVLRAYQVAAVEAVLTSVNYAVTSNKYGKDAGGHIWHTTGAGKTLTSYKAAQLTIESPEVAKVLFVVDRKDLDKQTIEEYKKFGGDIAERGSSTADLINKLNDANSRIIVTTIQKLSRVVQKENSLAVYNQPTVIIFDECHRTQFGAMHKDITAKFKKHVLFGFTGTPIFEANSDGLKTTESYFGKALHKYTIIDAIGDKNVLPFKVEYVNTLKCNGQVGGKAEAIDEVEILHAPERIGKIVDYILANFNLKTHRDDRHLDPEVKRNNGFSALFTVDSIDEAKLCYKSFMDKKPKDFRVYTIFTAAQNEDSVDVTADGLDGDSKQFLGAVIKNYNADMKTAFSTDDLNSYYRDLTGRIKANEVDLVIVVNMLMTGFDAQCINTIFVDRYLKYHGLIQSFSRTNRIGPSKKTYGNIVCFRDLSARVDEALKTFGADGAAGIVLLRSYADYLNGYDTKQTDGTTVHTKGWIELSKELQTTFPRHKAIVSEKQKMSFLLLMNELLHIRNILKTFDRLAGYEVLPDGAVRYEADTDTKAGYIELDGSTIPPALLELIDGAYSQEDGSILLKDGNVIPPDYRTILSPRLLQDYMSVYHEIHRAVLSAKDKASVLNEVTFDVELVKSVTIGVDYILYLIENLKGKAHTDRLAALDTIRGAMGADADLHDKKELIERFIEAVNYDKAVKDQWVKFVRKELRSEIAKLVTDNRLNSESLEAFINANFGKSYIDFGGTLFACMLPSMPRFSGGKEGLAERNRVVDLLKSELTRMFAVYATNGSNFTLLSQ